MQQQEALPVLTAPVCCSCTVSPAAGECTPHQWLHHVPGLAQLSCTMCFRGGFRAVPHQCCRGKLCWAGTTSGSGALGLVAACWDWARSGVAILSCRRQPAGREEGSTDPHFSHFAGQQERAMERKPHLPVCGAPLGHWKAVSSTSSSRLSLWPQICPSH